MDLFSYNQCQFFIKNYYLPLWLAFLKDQVPLYFRDLKTFLITPMDVAEIKRSFLMMQQKEVKKGPGNNGKKCRVFKAPEQEIFTVRDVAVCASPLKDK